MRLFALLVLFPLSALRPQEAKEPVKQLTSAQRNAAKDAMTPHIAPVTNHPDPADLTPRATSVSQLTRRWAMKRRTPVSL